MNVLSVLSVVLLASAISAFTEQEYQNAFTQWTHDFNRAYSVDEFHTRYAIFKWHMDFVQAWNADKTHTYTVALNQFADITDEEFKRIYLMPTTDHSARLANAVPTIRISAPADGTVDWRDKGAVTDVKNQGQCNGCWSFSATGAVEGAHEIATGDLVSLSEQNLIDCSTSYGNNGCNGGRPDQAFKYIIDNQGIATEDSYPFTGQDGNCQAITDVGATLSSYSAVDSGNEDMLTSSLDQQPVSVAIDASLTSFKTYSSGVYNDPSCSSTQLDHAVLAIGYGSDDAGGDYYIVKNSWGTSWGIEGYVWMARGNGNQCGIATDPVYPIV